MRLTLKLSIGCISTPSPRSHFLNSWFCFIRSNSALGISCKGREIFQVRKGTELLSSICQILSSVLTQTSVTLINILQNCIMRFYSHVTYKDTEDGRDVITHVPKLHNQRMGFKQKWSLNLIPFNPKLSIFLFWSSDQYTEIQLDLYSCVTFDKSPPFPSQYVKQRWNLRSLWIHW